MLNISDYNIGNFQISRVDIYKILDLRYEVTYHEGHSIAYWSKVWYADAFQHLKV